MRRENGRVWNRLQSQEKPRQDQLQELRNEVTYIDVICFGNPYAILQSLFVLKMIQTCRVFTYLPK